MYVTDQNKGGALLKSPMRTATHEKSRISSAISVELNGIVCNICFTIINKISDSFRIFGSNIMG